MAEGTSSVSIQLAEPVTPGSSEGSPMKSVRESGKAKAQPKLLTASQLSDIFLRLDKDNSGSLDFEEFKEVVKKLGLKVDSKDLKRIYNESDDSHKSGTGANSLSLREFQTAYTKLFLSMTKASNSTKGLPDEEAVVRVLRYGTSEGSYFVDEYVGTTSSVKQKTTTKKSPGVAEVSTSTQKVDLSLKSLKVLANAETPGVFWWFDVAMHDVSDDVARTEIALLFDLPDNAVLSGNYNSFGNLLPKEPRYRVGFGTGSIHSTPSLHLFVQALWLQGRPLRYLLPAWLDYSTKGDDWWTKNVHAPVKDYYSTRIAWMFSSARGHHQNQRRELHAALESAESLARRIAVTTSGDDSEQAEAHFEEFAVPISSAHIIARNGDAPTWLMPTSELKKHPPQIQYANLGMHLLMHDKASTPGILLTIRQLESDLPFAKKRKPLSGADAELASRSGIIGRILTGVRCHIRLVLVEMQGAHTGGSINDHLIDLATLITAAVNNFSMNTMGSINEWLSVLEDDSIDLPVSKHTEHCRSVNNIISTINDYLQPMLEIISGMKEAERTKAEMEIAGASSGPPQHATGLRRRSSIGGSVVPVHEATSEITAFLGNKPTEAFFDKLLEGSEDFKGLNYWSKRQDELGDKADKTKAQVVDALEEKRAFYGYVLAIATVFLSPASVLTGYFGMNFTNMKELNGLEEGGEVQYPSAPGVVLLWIIGGVCYGLLLFMTIHWRILYSTT